MQLTIRSNRDDLHLRPIPVGVNQVMRHRNGDGFVFLLSQREHNVLLSSDNIAAVSLTLGDRLPCPSRHSDTNIGGLLSGRQSDRYAMNFQYTSSKPRRVTRHGRQGRNDFPLNGHRFNWCVA